MLQTRVHRIVESVAACAVLASAASLAYGQVPTSEQWQAATFFSAFGLIACLLLYKTSSTTSGSIGFLPFLSVAVISPNFAALAAVFVSILGAELVARRKLLKAVFNISQYVFAEASAIAVYVVLGGESILNRQPPVAAFLGLVATFLILNKAAVSIVVAASSGADVRAHWLRSMRLSALYDLLAFPLILFFAVAYARLGPEWSAALALPMLGLRQMYKSNVALQKINEELLQLIVAAIEARDPYTSGHSQRVARYAGVIARAVGLSAREAERVVTAALLHDVGKIHEEFAPILRKPGRLTDQEYEIMKTHSAKSAALVGKVSHFADLVPLIHAHHEAWDGSGYPLGISALDIPHGARIIALADTIDAMSTSRPYRRAMREQEVLAELQRECSRQFDPALVAIITTGAVWKLMIAEIESATQAFPASREVEDLIAQLKRPEELTSIIH